MDIIKAMALPDAELDAELARFAQMAIDVQSACNIGGLAHSLVDAQTLVRAKLQRKPDGYSTDDVNKHPIVQMFIHQMSYLSGMSYEGKPSVYMKAHDECEALAKAGKTT